MKDDANLRLSFGDVCFDALAGTLGVDGQEHRLRPQTAAVLAVLLQHVGRLVERDELFRQVWGDAVVTDNSLAQCVAEIRRALGPGREGWLETAPRRGYLLRPPQQPEPSPAVDHATRPQVAVVTPGTAQATKAADAEGLVVGAPNKRRRTRMLLLLLMATLVAGLSAWGLARRSGAPDSRPLTLLVLPLDTTALWRWALRAGRRTAPPRDASSHEASPLERDENLVRAP